MATKKTQTLLVLRQRASLGEGTRERGEVMGVVDGAVDRKGPTVDQVKPCKGVDPREIRTLLGNPNKYVLAYLDPSRLP